MQYFFYVPDHNLMIENSTLPLHDQQSIDHGKRVEENGKPLSCERRGQKTLLADMGNVNHSDDVIA